MMFYAAFNSISVISRRQLTLFMLSWVSPVLGWALKCLAQGHSHEKNPEDSVRLEPRIHGLRVKHFTTGPRVVSLQDLGTGGLLFDPLLGQYSFRGLMIVVTTRFILLSPVFIVSTMVM